MSYARSRTCESCGVTTWRGRICHTCEQAESDDDSAPWRSVQPRDPDEPPDSWAQHLQDTYDEGKAAALDGAVPVEVGKGKQGIHGEWEAPIRGDDPVMPGEYWLVRRTP